MQNNYLIFMMLLKFSKPRDIIWYFEKNLFYLPTKLVEYEYKI